MASDGNLRMSNVSKRYGTVPAVTDVSFELPAGEMLCVLGPSGCGKTTTLRIVAGFVTPDAGSVFVGDREITALPPNKRLVGMVFQNYALFPHMTVYGNVMFGLRRRRVPTREASKIIHDVLALLGLEDKARTYPAQLSGGEQQRVALARVLAIRPSLLLFDEPLSNLDAELRREMRAELKNLQREARATGVYVTHDQEEALAIADKIAVMRDGSVLQFGTPAEVYDEPANTAVARFVGTSNVVTAKIDRVADDRVVARTSRGSFVQARITQHCSPTDLTHGAAVAMAVKPERVRLEREQSGDGQMNSLKGTVKSSTRLGALVHTVVAVDDIEEAFNVYTPIGEAEDLPPPGTCAYAQWRVIDGVVVRS